MEYQNLLQKIQNSNVPESLKEELLEIVHSYKDVNSNLIEKLQSVIDDFNINLINQDAAEKVLQETENLIKQLNQKEQDLKQISKSIIAEVEEIDLDEARKKVSAS